MISRAIAESVFALMDARGIQSRDIVAINLYNSGPTLHLEPYCMLRAFPESVPVYQDHKSNLHGVFDADGIRIVAMFSTQEDMEKLRAVGVVEKPYPVFDMSEAEL